MEFEKRTLQRRLDGLAAVLDGNEAEVKKYVEGFLKHEGGDATTATSQAGRSALGQAPPTGSFRDLIPISSLDVASQDYQDVDSMDAIKKVTKHITDMRKPLQDLQNSVSGAIKDLLNARSLMEQKGRASRRGPAKAKQAEALPFLWLSPAWFLGNLLFTFSSPPRSL